MGEKELIEQIKENLSHFETERRLFEGRWKEAINYTAPSVFDFSNLDTVPTTPERKTSSPCNFMDVLVSGLVGYSISPNIVWLKLSLEQTELLDRYGVKDWLEKTEIVFYSEFNRSNMYKQIPHLVRSACTIGHGVILIDEDMKNERLRFSFRRANEIYLEADEYDEVDTVYRVYQMTVKNAVEFFGKENMSQDTQNDYEDSKRRYKKIRLLHAVYPREEYDENALKNTRMKYASVDIELDKDHLIRESGYKENPYAVFEWSKLSGFAYSDSPAMQAMPDIRLLNIANETMFQIAQMSAMPALSVPDDMKDVHMIPRGYNFYTDPTKKIEPIRTGENYPITIQIVQSIEQRVKEWFSVDFFLMLQQQQGNRTATEVMELQGEKAAVLSSLIVGLNQTLQQIVTRSFNLLLTAGKIPDPPQSLIGSNAQLKVDFVGPLAQAQKKYHQAGGIAQALSLAQPIIQAFPPAADYIDADILVKRAMEGTGMPQSVIREDDDVTKIRQARAEQQAALIQQQALMQQSQTLAQNFNKLNEPIKSGSAMAEIGKQLTGGFA